MKCKNCKKEIKKGNEIKFLTYPYNFCGTECGYVFNLKEASKVNQGLLESFIKVA